jgi:Flp pilus assembly protein TadD
MCPDNIPRDEIMTRRFAVLIAITLLLGGCGDSPAPVTPAANPDPASLAITEYSKGLGFCDKEDWDAAIVCFSEVIRLQPDDAEAYNNRGNAYAEKGEDDKASKDLAKAKELEAKK